MELTITEDMIIKLAQKYFETTNLDGLLDKFNKHVNETDSHFLYVDALLRPIVVVDNHVEKITDGMIYEGKIILPFQLFCLYGNKLDTSFTNSSIQE